jgi:putative membrane protein
MHKPLDLDKPQRQNPFGVAVIFVRNLRIALNIFISVVFVQFGTKMDFLSLSIYAIAGILVLLFLLLSYYQYRKFFFYIEDDKFVLEEGVFKRDKMTIAFDRIQSVNLSQNIIQQILNVTALKVDTAGSKAKEMEIPALDKAYARALQKRLLELKQQRIAEEGEDTAEDLALTELDEAILEDRGLGEKPLVKLSMLDVLRVGLTENHLRSGLILFAVINGYIWQFEDYILKPFEQYLGETKDNILAYGLILVPISIVLFLVIGVLFSVIQSVLKYFNLRFYANAKGVRMTSGLFKKAEYNIPVNKIQYIKSGSNPLRKAVGYRTITVKQAGSEEASDKKSLQIPGAREDQLSTVLDFFFEERHLENQGNARAHALLFTQLSFYISVLPTIGLGIAGYWYPLAWYAIPAVIALVLFFSFKYYKSVGVHWNAEMLTLNKGYVFPKTYFLKFFKMQNVSLRQSFLQKPRGLAHLVFHTAAGDLRMPHMPYETAKQLYDYMLYRIESSNESWM